MLNKNEVLTIAAGHYPLAGARGCGYSEEILAKEIATKLTNMFNQEGFEAHDVTPSGTGYTVNSQLQAEVAAANKYTNSKLHLCIHFNAFNSSANGTETWIYAQGGNAEKFAIKINNELVNLGFVDRGVKVSGNSLYVPRMTTAPCCLIEVCFIDSQSDMNIYNLDDTCKAIFKAVAGFEYDNTDLEDTEIDNTGCIQDYNATVINDFFYTRNSSGVKDGGRIEIGTKIKVLDVSYSKQLVYIAYLENNIEKEAYITNATNCIEYLYQDQWSNGSTKEIVYETSNCSNSIGELSTWEKATPIYRENGILHVVYSTAKGINTKSGYVKYNGGFNKF